MDDENVVSIEGGVEIFPEKSQQTVVRRLEEVLEMARSGEVVGIALVMVHRDKATSYRLVGLTGGYSMLGGLEVVKMDVINDIRD